MLYLESHTQKCAHIYKQTLLIHTHILHNKILYTHTRTQTKKSLCAHSHTSKDTHTQFYVCMYNTKSSCIMWNYTLTQILSPHTRIQTLLLLVHIYTHTHTHTHTHTQRTHTHTRHNPNVMHHLESGEQRWASTGKYWKYLFLSTDERDVILQIYLVVLWICCCLICMTTHYLSLRTQRQLQRWYHLYYYWAIMWRYTEGGNWAS